MHYPLSNKKGKNTKIKNRNPKVVQQLTFDEKIKECYRKINIRNQKITLGDLDELYFLYCLNM